MKVRFLNIIPVTALLWAASAGAQECSAPSTAIDLPDGKTATVEQMTAAQANVKSVQAAMDEYLKCLDGLASGQKGAITAQGKKDLLDRHNTAVAAISKLAAPFNDQVKAFKSR